MSRTRPKAPPADPAPPSPLTAAQRRDLVAGIFARRIVDASNIVTSFRKDVAESDCLVDALVSCTERVLVAEHSLRLLRPLAGIALEDELAWDDRIACLVRWQEGLTKTLCLRDDYSHRSTSAVDNVASMAEFRATQIAWDTIREALHHMRKHVVEEEGP